MECDCKAFQNQFQKMVNEIAQNVLQESSMFSRYKKLSELTGLYIAPANRDKLSLYLQRIAWITLGLSTMHPLVIVKFALQSAIDSNAQMRGVLPMLIDCFFTQTLIWDQFHYIMSDIDFGKSFNAVYFLFGMLGVMYQAVVFSLKNALFDRIFDFLTTNANESKFMMFFLILYYFFPTACSQWKRRNPKQIHISYVNNFFFRKTDVLL